MSARISLPLIVLCGATPVLSAQSNLPSLDTEHVDVRINYTSAGTNHLSLVVRDEDHAVDYQTNQIVLVATEDTKLTLPPGTPFGEAGEPLWVLPQSRSPGQAVLFLGLAAGGGGAFSGPLALQLKNVEGPGRFYVWQSDEFGGLNVKMNSADGVDPSDKVDLLPAGHDHYNWGFSTSGVFCVTLQVSGTRVGETQPIVSPEATFVFHVLPLGVVTPFGLWQKAHWLQGTDGSTNGPAVDPDNDGLINAIEYASNLDPKLFSTNGGPVFSFVTNATHTYGALTFTRVKSAPDIIYQPAARNEVSVGTWEVLTHEAAILDEGYTERVTMRDYLPTTTTSTRFYQFRVKLTHP